jgi:hypothetical protein
MYRVAMLPRQRPHPRWRPPVRSPALLLLLVLVAVAAAAALLVHPTATAVPLDPHIPNAHALSDAGLSGAPDPSQPTRPIAVDRVLLDGAATYVQYHIAGPQTPWAILTPPSPMTRVCGSRATR